MANKQKHTENEAEESEERWLLTYSDMITLLYGDNIFEKGGITRDRTRNHEKTQCLRGISRT